MFQRGHFLVWIQDDGLVETVLEPLQRYAVTRRTKALGEVLDLLRDASRWSGLLVDLDGLGPRPLDVIRRLRREQPLVPLLLLSGSQPSVGLINASHSLRAELVCKPVAHVNLVSFVQRALTNGWLPCERVAAWVDELAQRQALTPREVQLLAYALGDESRPDVMRRLGITENTLKTQVRGLLRKCGARSMDELTKNVLREALLFRQSDTDESDLSSSGEYRLASA